MLPRGKVRTDQPEASPEKYPTQATLMRRLCLVYACTPSVHSRKGSMPALPDTQYTAFRLAEKHWKDRSVNGRLPSLHDQDVVDLSRPELQEDDPVWQAGWWGATPGDEQASRWRKWKKGKERARGERPEACTRGAKKITLRSGHDAWVVAEGPYNVSLPSAPANS